MDTGTYNAAALTQGFRVEHAHEGRRAVEAQALTSGQVALLGGDRQEPCAWLQTLQQRGRHAPSTNGHQESERAEAADEKNSSREEGGLRFADALPQLLLQGARLTERCCSNTRARTKRLAAQDADTIPVAHGGLANASFVRQHTNSDASMLRRASHRTCDVCFVTDRLRTATSLSRATAPNTQGQHRCYSRVWRM